MIAAPAVTIHTIPSAGVTAGALRLICRGYLARVHYTGSEEGHLFWTLPSESGQGLYQIEYTPAEQTLRCTCPAGRHGMPCKHVRLIQLQHGWAVEGVRS